MQWIAPTEKDTGTETLEKRLWAAADALPRQLRPHAAQVLAARPRPDLPALRRGPLRRAARRAGEGQAAGSPPRLAAWMIPPPTTPRASSTSRPTARFDHLLTPARGRGRRRRPSTTRCATSRSTTRSSPASCRRPTNLFTEHAAQGAAQEGLRDSRRRGLRRLRPHLRVLPRRVRPHRRPEGRRVLHAEQHRPPARRGASSRSTAASSTPLRLRRHVRAVAPASSPSTRRTPPPSSPSTASEKTDETVTPLPAEPRRARPRRRHPPRRQRQQLLRRPARRHRPFDFVLANPPFNVNAVDKERLEGDGRPRPPLSLRPAAHRQRQLPLDSALLLRAERHRAAPASSWRTPPPTPAPPSRSSAGSSSRPAPWTSMVAVGPNMFYTVTLPCTLWFLDRGKAKTPRADTVLFIDARHIYRQVDRAHRDWTAGADRLPRQRRPPLSRRSPRLHPRRRRGEGEARGGLRQEADVRRRARPLQGRDARRRSKRRAGRSTPVATSASPPART